MSPFTLVFYIQKLLWVLSWENLSSGVSTRYDSNRPAQLHRLARFVLRLNVPVNNFSVISGRSHRFLGNRLARGLQFWIQKLVVLYYLTSEQQRRWSDCADAQADLRLCCSHMAKTGFFMTWLISWNANELKWVKPPTYRVLSGLHLVQQSSQ